MMARMAIGSMLRDPDSARFQDVTFRKRHGLPVTCGEVNARNGFGGYAGFVRFFSLGAPQTTAFENQTPASAVSPILATVLRRHRRG